MKNEPILVIMAAGMGSRFGGLKQITPVDDKGHLIIDFSLYDAWRAGFRRIVFVIKKEFEQIFREQIGNRMEKWFQVNYVFQELDRLPEGVQIPEGRKKPWGTGHAIACCRGIVDAPFAVINADDFYGPKAFAAIYQYLSNLTAEDSYAMVGYRLRNTVTEHGFVSRGICEIKNGYLMGITERTEIYKDGMDGKYRNGDETFSKLAGDTVVSMNLWGFSAHMIDELWERFPAFLKENLPINPKKCEFFLPSVVNQQIQEQTAVVKVLPCEENWFGVTYKEDLENVVHAIRKMKEQGIYREDLWQ